MREEYSLYSICTARINSIDLDVYFRWHHSWFSLASIAPRQGQGYLKNNDVKRKMQAGQHLYWFWLRCWWNEIKRKWDENIEGRWITIKVKYINIQIQYREENILVMNQNSQSLAVADSDNEWWWWLTSDNSSTAQCISD